MNLTLYYGSGSPYAWRAQLALEHNALPYELKMLSFDAGDARKAVVDELGMFTRAMRGEYLAGPLSAADFAFYPFVAFMKRAELRLPDLDADGMLTPEMRAWKGRIEALPFFDKTIPPHWKKA